MPFLIGTDEAGYGPNFGPLCVSATVWEVDDGIEPESLYKRLKKVVANCVDQAAKKKIVWADSKAVYKSGSGLDHLERGVLTAMALIDQLPSDWQELWQGSGFRVQGSVRESETPSNRLRFSTDPSRSASAVAIADPFSDLPWHVNYSATLPIWMNAADGPAWMLSDSLAELSDCIRAGLAAAGVRLVAILYRAVFPAEFNELAAASNKADVLSRVTLSLVAEALELIAGESVHVCCDKHGGRDYYLPLLQSHFDEWIEVRDEASAASHYRFHNDAQRVDIGFYVGGERFLPVALASMTAKYLRETAMRPFNEFWCARIPGLKPTAGYPTDARRFKKQIAEVQQELQIDDRILWRCR